MLKCFGFCNFVEQAKTLSFTIAVSQAVDGNFTGSSRAMSSQAADSLVDAVDNLTTFVSNPEFASVPAKISAEVCKTFSTRFSITKKTDFLLSCNYST